MSLLKADLTRVLDVLHWHYSLIPMRERLRKSLTKSCIFYVVAYTALAGVLLHVFHVIGNDFAAMLTCVVYWGIIGGFQAGGEWEFAMAHGFSLRPIEVDYTRSALPDAGSQS